VVQVFPPLQRLKAPVLLELVLSMGGLSLGGNRPLLHRAAVGRGERGSRQTPVDPLTPTHPHHREGCTNFTGEPSDKLGNSFVSYLAASETLLLSTFSPLGRGWLLL